MKEIRSIIDAYSKIDYTKTKVALASVVSIEGSSYRRIGARMLVQSDGMWTGGISGGCLEGDALRKAQHAIHLSQASLVTYDTLDEDSNQIGIGLGCNGKIEVLFNPIDPHDDGNEISLLRNCISSKTPIILLKILETAKESELGKVKLVEGQKINGDFLGVCQNVLNEKIVQVLEEKRSYILDQDGKKILVEFVRPELEIILAGNNHDLSAMVGLCNELGWKVKVVGRKRKIPKSVFSKIDQLLEYENAASLSCNEYTVVVLMTHDYKRDLDLLPIFLKKRPSYLGILGPKKRLIKLQNDLDINLSKVPFLFSPTGLDLGAESPEEIALSICAEILAIQRAANLGFLKDRLGPIHS